MLRLLLFLLFARGGIASAQHDWTWTFGDSILMRFPGGAGPVVDPNARTRYFFEASASYSNALGNLMLYASDDSSFDQFHQRIPNNFQYYGGDLTNGVLILPAETILGRYLVFYLSFACSIPSNCLRYSLVQTAVLPDSTLTNDVAPYYHPFRGLAEKLSAVRAADGGWWVLYHGERDEFLRIKVKGTLVSTFTQQNYGSSYVSVGNNPFGTLGEMVSSPQGDKVLAVTMTGMVDVFDFDRCTGLLSNWDSLGTPALIWPGPDAYYGCSFSPDGTKIYVSEDDNDGGDRLFQWDLTALDVRASKTLLFTAPDSVEIGQHQLGPDGKIYISNINRFQIDTIANYHLSVINDPNQAGLACNFSYASLYLEGRRTTYNLPNLPNYSLPPLVAQYADCGPPRRICPGDSVLVGFPDTTGGAVVFAWGGPGITSPGLAQHWVRPDSTAWYYLTVTDSAVGIPCGVTYDSVLVTVAATAELPMASLGMDTTVCAGDSVLLRGPAAPVGASWLYVWSTGDTTVQLMAAAGGSYALTVTNPASSLHCFVDQDTIAIAVFAAPQPLPVQVAGVDVVVCNGDSVLLGAAAVPGWDYLWSPASFLSSATVAMPVSRPAATLAYVLLVSDSASGGACGEVRDTVNITVEEQDLQNLQNPQDVEFCVGECFLLGVPGVSGFQYLWSPTLGLASPEMSLTRAQPAATTVYTLTVVNPAVQSLNCRERRFVVTATADACHHPSFIAVNGDGIAEVLDFGDHAGPVALRVFDVAGRLVHEDGDYGNDWNATGLAHGLYVYRVTVGGDCPSAFAGKVLVLR
jgi:CHU_C Type IX secretion signal domain